MQYTFDEPRHIGAIRFIFDSDLNRAEKNMPCHYPLRMQPVSVPRTMLRAFRLEALNSSGHWVTVARVQNNCQRLVRIGVDLQTRAIRFVPEATWSSERVHIFAWDIDG